ncbi:MAG: SLC26A/SulP transporter family protein [Chloroflexi bacterium]|nr:SLC26A/SulP transporter family protein [Chloroflexota bacterium]
MPHSDTLPGQLQTSLNELRDDLAPARLLAALPTGLMNGLTGALVVISLSSLVFAQALPENVPQGVALGLMSTFLGGLAILLFSSYPATIYVVQDGPAAIMSLAAVGIVAQLAASPERQLPTVLAAVALSALLTGLAYYLLGRFQLGNLIRYLPYPVIGGFLAGTGWLLFKGSLDLLAGQNLAGLLEGAVLLRWLPPLLLALALLFLLRRISHPYLITAFSLALVLGFYAVMVFSGTTLAQAQAQGWLMASMPGGGAWQPLTPARLALVDWPAVFSQSGNILTAVFTSLVALLLGASGLEVSVRRPISLNQELKANGIANLASGLLSGMIGYAAISLSVMGKRIGLESRLFGLLTGLVSLSMLLLGLGTLRYFPVPLLGFLLFFFGLSFLSEWLLDGWRRLSPGDYAIVWLILIVIATVGFLEGVLLGLLLSVLLFVLSYSQVSVVSRELDGIAYSSRVDRRPEHRAILDEHGAQVLVLRLRGFVFFGTANSIQARLQARLEDRARPRLRYLIIDFQHVARLDSSAINSFVMMRMRAEALGFILIFSGLSSEKRAQLESEGFKDDLVAHTRIFAALDYAMEWCEDELLKAEERGATVLTHSLQKALKENLPSGTDVKRLMGYFERQELPEPRVLIRQGDPPRGLYFLESGRARVEMDESDGGRAWLRTMESGVTFGEMQVYSGQAASATVITAGPTVVHYLSSERLAQMEKEQPALAIAFHRFIANVIGARLIQQNRALNDLRDE